MATLNIHDTSLSILSPDDRGWMSYLANNPDANIFHHPAWLGLLADSYSFKPFILGKVNSRGEIEAGIPLISLKSFLNKDRWVSLPFTDHCAPLFSNSPALSYLMDYFSTLGRGRNKTAVELRWDYPVHADLHKTFDYVLHRLRLASNEEIVSRRIKPKHFRQIKVAEQRGVHIEKGDDLGFMKEFYQLHLITRHRKGVPVQPWRFFELLAANIIQQGLGFILLAYKDSECIAGAVFLSWNNTLTYKYAASATEARPLLAMDLLLWTAIQWACNHGYTWMDMGRTAVEDTGLRTFKMRWGSEETPLPYSMFSQKHSPSVNGRLAAMVKMVIRSSPQWVCRSAGEIAYRYLG